MRRFVIGFVIGATLFGAGWSSARNFYDIDDVMNRLDDVEQKLDEVQTSIIVWCG